jgi:helix-turn-helix protein
MAQSVGLSAAHFARMFRKSTGETPHQFVLRLRLERAKAMLRAPDARVLDVAVACGFKTQHFAQAFRDVWGVSPTEYRQDLVGSEATRASETSAEDTTVLVISDWPRELHSQGSFRGDTLHQLRAELLRGAEKEGIHHGFNPGCHLLGGDTVGGLKPAARGSKNGPGCGGRQQCRIDTGCDPMKSKAFLEHALDDGDDGAFEWYPSQLTGTTCVLGKIVADAECNGAEGSMAVGKGDGAALYQVSKADVCHGLQQRVFVWIMQIKGGPV